MFNIKVSLDEYEIIYSSIAHVKSGNVLKFEIENLKAYIEIIYDKEKDNSNIEYHQEGTDLFIKLINFKNPFGSGVMKPWEIGTINNRSLHISFSINYGEDTTTDYSLFSYCIYLGKEVEHGE